MIPPAGDVIANWLRRNFLAYQQEWILDETRFVITNKGRQLGMTDSAAARCVLRGRYARRPQIVISASQGNADELIAAARRHCEFLAATGDPGAADFVVDNTECLEWRDGASISALAANPRTARSFHGDLYLDEFAYHADADAIWAAAAPMATRSDWSIRVWSTPNGAIGKFYDWCTNTPAGWKLTQISLDDAERDGLKLDRAALMTLVGGDQRAFAEAYLLQFLDADLQYLPGSLVKGAEWGDEIPDLTGCRILAGLDVARHVDLTALVIVALRDEARTKVVDGKRRTEIVSKAWVIASLTCQRSRFKAQYALIEEARAVFAWEKLYVDKTGLGEAVAEELVEKYGASEVVPVHFTEQAKATMATSVFRLLNEDRIRIACDESESREIRADMVSLRRIVTRSGHITYSIPKTSRGHGDRFWALAMPLVAALEPTPFRGMGQTPIAA